MSPFFTSFYIYFTFFLHLQKTFFTTLDYPLINEIIQPKTKKGEKIMGKRRNYFIVGGIVLLIMVLVLPEGVTGAWQKLRGKSD